MSESSRGHEGVMPMEFEAEGGIKISTLQPNHTDSIFAILQSDPDISKNVTWVAKVESEQDVLEQIQKFNANRELRYGIFLEEELVGYIGAWREVNRSREHECGMGYFCDPKYRGRGIISRSVQAMMKQLEQNLSARTFVLCIADPNTVSQAVAVNLGFKRTDDTYFDEALQSEERFYEKTSSA